MEVRYDVFLSFSGDDRPKVAELYDALKRAKLRAFLDDRGIRYGHSVTTDIEEALRGSKMMLVYYSASFPLRPACQYELRYAYLTALRAGQLEQRILVVNPEDPQSDHLLPLELSTHRYLRTWHSKTELAELVSLVGSRAAAIDSAFPGMDFSATTAHHGRFEPTVDFVGRYRDRWALHSALHRNDHPLMVPVTSPAVASLTGMTGIGKTSLAKVYAHDYGFLYPGGVYWTDLTGANGPADRVRAVHSARLRELAEQVDGPLGDMTRRQLLGWWHRHLRHRDGPVLWVVDAIPANIPDEVLAELVPDTGNVYTLLIGQRELPPEFAMPVRLGGLTADDGRELFSMNHKVSGDEVDAVDTVVARLGGHPYAIRFAAAGARGRQGLWHLRERVDHLTSDAGVLDRALAMTRDAVENLGGSEHVVLVLSAVCAPDPLPASLIEEVIGALDPSARSRTAEVLTTLDRGMLVTREGTSWQVHQLVREAVRQSSTADELGAVAVIAARRLLALAETGTPSLAPHARALVARTTASPDLSVRLNELVATHHDGRGEPGLAAPFHENLHGWQPGRLRHLHAAARARLAAGHHDQALAHARKLAELATDDLMSMRAECVRAEVLDAQAKHREADPIWTWLTGCPALPTAPLDEQIAIRTAHIRHRRALGHFTDAALLATELLTETDKGFAEELIPVRLELVAIGMATDDRIGARAAAQEILDHYHRRELPNHVNALEAAALLHEAQLEVFILEKFPSEDDWAKAEAALRELVESARRDLGAHNPRTLTITVAHLRVMVGRGAPAQVLREYSGLPRVLADQLGTDHRLYLRAVFLLGQAHAQNRERRQASDNYRLALAGQERVLGPGHPETLRTRYELGVMQYWLHDRAGAKRMFDSVRRDVVQEVGRRNDLYGQALTGGLLASVLPSAALHLFDWFEQQRQKKPGS